MLLCTIHVTEIHGVKVRSHGAIAIATLQLLATWDSMDQFPLVTKILYPFLRLRFHNRKYSANRKLNR